MDAAILDIMNLFKARGGSAYETGEAVTQMDHALQCADLAERTGAEPSLVAAALLHDIGHLIAGGHVKQAADDGIDQFHEELGADYLAPIFGFDVSEPVRLHVAAKRYLVATRDSYAARLSPASARSLELQGGPMGIEEIEDFETRPGAAEAIKLRMWDEAAKDQTRKVPGLAHYVPLLEHLREMMRKAA